MTVPLRPWLGLCLVLAAGCPVSLAAAPPTDGRTQSFAVSGFTRVRVAGPDDVSVRPGAQFAVVATGAPELLARLEVEVHDGELSIGRKRATGRRWNVASGEGVQIEVTLPALGAATLAGSGNLRVAAISGASFKVALTGSGEIDVSGIKVDSLQVDLTGSGNIRLDGSARQGALALTGSGDIEAGRLQAGSLEVRLNGAGDVRATASGHASINLAGSGDVLVQGTVDCTISRRGSGAAHCRR